jgi:PKD repeat protein
MWDFNGSQILDTLGWQNYLISIGAFLPEPPSVSLYINDKGCLSDTVFKYSGAVPNFTMDAGPTRGCDELTVNFSSSLLTEDHVDFLWEFHDGTTSSDSALTKAYNEPDFYDVKLSITNPVTQCTNSFAIDSMIKVFPTPTAEISASPDGCYPDTMQLIYIHSIDSSMSYWEFEGMHQVGTGNNTVTVVFDNPTAGVKLIVEEFGCVSEPAELRLKRKPRFDFYSGSTEGCHPFSTEIFTETNDNFIHFEWVTDSVPLQADQSRLFQASGPGSYDIGLIANSMETGCSDTLVKTNWIEVHPKPNANFRLDYPIAMIENARITFTNRTPDAEYFLWDFDDGNFSDGIHAIHTYSEPGEFWVQLIAETLNGCKDTTGVAVQILPSAVHTPNAFRPDSPIEANRTFMPVTTGIDPFRFHFIVYNRQGQVVFESDSYTNPWDGTTTDGQPALMGNYIWIARYFDIQGFEREQKGQVLLIR